MEEPWEYHQPGGNAGLIESRRMKTKAKLWLQLCSSTKVKPGVRPFFVAFSAPGVILFSRMPVSFESFKNLSQLPNKKYFGGMSSSFIIKGIYFKESKPQFLFIPASIFSPQLKIAEKQTQSVAGKVSKSNQ